MTPEQQAFLRDVYAFQHQIAPGITPGEIDAMTNREIDERFAKVLNAAAAEHQEFYDRVWRRQQHKANDVAGLRLEYNAEFAKWHSRRSGEE